MGRFLKMYLITVALSSVAIGVLFWFAERNVSHSGKFVPGPSPGIGRSLLTVTPSLLDTPDITLQELGRMAESLRGDEQSMYEARITALRQILLVLGSSSHSASALHDVFRVYREDLSESQREIVSWFEAGGSALDRKWERSPAVSSLSQFHRQLSSND